MSRLYADDHRWVRGKLISVMHAVSTPAPLRGAYLGNRTRSPGETRGKCALRHTRPPRGAGKFSSMSRLYADDHRWVRGKLINVMHAVSTPAPLRGAYLGNRTRSPGETRGKCALRHTRPPRGAGKFSSMSRLYADDHRWVRGKLINVMHAVSTPAPLRGAHLGNRTRSPGETRGKCALRHTRPPRGAGKFSSMSRLYADDHRWVRGKLINVMHAVSTPAPLRGAHLGNRTRSPGWHPGLHACAPAGRLSGQSNAVPGLAPGATCPRPCGAISSTPAPGLRQTFTQDIFGAGFSKASCRRKGASPLVRFLTYRHWGKAEPPRNGAQHPLSAFLFAATRPY